MPLSLAKLNPGRRASQGLLGMLLLLLGGPPLYMWVATPAPRPVTFSKEIQLAAKRTYSLYVVNWGYHTSVIIEQPPGARLGPPGSEQALFVEYSWGDREFYMAFKRDPVSALRAFLWPTASVMFVRGWPQAPAPAIGIQDIYYRSITVEQWQTLVTSLEKDFMRTAIGHRQAALVVDTPYDGRFYAAREFYIGWSDCNAWTVRHLAKVGVAQDRLGIIFAVQVAPQLRGFELIQ